VLEVLANNNTNNQDLIAKEERITILLQLLAVGEENAALVLKQLSIGKYKKEVNNGISIQNINPVKFKNEIVKKFITNAKLVTVTNADPKFVFFGPSPSLLLSFVLNSRRTDFFSSTRGHHSL
jgi:flagellar motor switch protein FliG